MLHFVFLLLLTSLAFLSIPHSKSPASLALSVLTVSRLTAPKLSFPSDIHHSANNRNSTHFSLGHIILFINKSSVPHHHCISTFTFCYLLLHLLRVIPLPRSFLSHCYHNLLKFLFSLLRVFVHVSQKYTKTHDSTSSLCYIELYLWSNLVCMWALLKLLLTSGVNFLSMTPIRSWVSLT